MKPVFWMGSSKGDFFPKEDPENSSAGFGFGA
jgi:hypothetical protein